MVYKNIKPGQRSIKTDNGRYFLAAETNSYNYFVNYGEGDVNAQVMMFSKSDLKLVSDNYFAFADLWQQIENGCCTNVTKRLAHAFKLSVESFEQNNSYEK